MSIKYNDFYNENSYLKKNISIYDYHSKRFA